MALTAGRLALDINLSVAGCVSERDSVGFKPNTALKVQHGKLEPYAEGEEVTMSFARLRTTWTPKHTPGKVLATWEHMADAADVHMKPVPPRESGWPSHEVFIDRLRADPTLKVDPLPEWLDTCLLEDGMRFFVEAWPLVFASFGWAVVGGFGCAGVFACLLLRRQRLRRRHTVAVAQSLLHACRELGG